MWRVKKATQADQSSPESQNGASHRQNQMGKGALALRLYDAPLGVGAGSLEQVAAPTARRVTSGTAEAAALHVTYRRHQC